ncbi:MAG: hypothetical protein [Bacteriophage sp.]|nr:MAG: hypothetical protein [Bacteriophage sp.]
MDEQEVVKQIRELQKKRTSLKEQDTVLILKIMELKDVLREGNINTNTYGLFCKVYDIKGGNIYVHELNTIDSPCLTKETYYWKLLKRHIIENVLKKSMIKL